MQVRKARPDLKVSTIRGNIDSRMARLKAGEFDAIVLAEAGLRRFGSNLLEESDLELFPLAVDTFVPAVNQGILACQYRSLDALTKSRLKPLTNSDVELAFDLERQVVSLLGADCSSALGVYYFAGTMHLQVFGCQSSEVVELSDRLADVAAVKDFVSKAIEAGAKKLLEETS